MLIKLGLRGLRVAKLEEDVSTSAAADGKAFVRYGEIIKLPKVQNIDLTARSQSADVDADDVTETLAQCTGYDGKVQRTFFKPAEQAMLLGETIQKDGSVASTSNDDAPYYATGFVCKMSGNKFYAAWILRCKYSTGDFSAETAGTEKLNPQSDTLSFKSSTRAADEAWRVYNVFDSEAEAESFLTLDRLHMLAEKKTDNSPDDGKQESGGTSSGGNTPTGEDTPTTPTDETE